MRIIRHDWAERTHDKIEIDRPADRHQEVAFGAKTLAQRAVKLDRLVEEALDPQPRFSGIGRSSRPFIAGDAGQFETLGLSRQDVIDDFKRSFDRTAAGARSTEFRQKAEHRQVVAFVPRCRERGGEIDRVDEDMDFGLRISGKKSGKPPRCRRALRIRPPPTGAIRFGSRQSKRRCRPVNPMDSVPDTKPDDPSDHRSDTPTARDEGGDPACPSRPAS